MDLRELQKKRVLEKRRKGPKSHSKVEMSNTNGVWIAAPWIARQRIRT